MSLEPQPVTSITQMTQWPATPGAERFERAAQYLSDIDPEHPDTQPPPAHPHLEHDIDMLELAYATMLFDSTEVLRNLPPNINEGMERITSTLEELDTTITFAGCIFEANDDAPGMLYPSAIIILSRDPDWMGVSTYLPLLREKRIALWESPGHPGQPGPFLALPGPSARQPRPPHSPPTGQPQLFATIATWHGALSCDWYPASDGSGPMQSIHNILP